MDWAGVSGSVCASNCRSNYYARKKREREGVKPRIYNRGRPRPGNSLDNKQKPVRDEELKEFLTEIVSGEGNAYGFWKLTVYLRREDGLVINKKKVYRLCNELDLLCQQRQLKVHSPRKLASKREILQYSTNIEEVVLSTDP